MPVRIGVIGVGYFGQHHARIFSTMEDSSLAAVADVDRTKAEGIGRRYDCKAFSDFRQLLPYVDAVSIVTPTTVHKDIAIDCLRASKHIFIEKPITSDLNEAEVIINEAKERGLTLQVGHLERYNSGLMKLSSLIDEPVFFESERKSPFVGRGIDVDITLDLMIHDIDIILSLVNSPVKSIRAVGADVLTDRLDVAKAWIDFENGISSLVTSSRLSGNKRRVLKVFQEESFLLLDFRSQKIIKHFKNGSKIFTDTIESEYKEPLKEELKSFVHCVLNQEKPLVTGEDGLNALKVALEISHILRNR